MLVHPAVFTRQMPKVSVVIPTLDEAANLPYVLPRIPTWVNEVIIVDGRSVDDTVAVAKSLMPQAHVVMEPRRGKGAALRAGFAASRGDIIVMLDADGSTDPGEITGYVGQLLAGMDFVKGSRFLQGGGTTDMSPHRKLGNAVFVALVRALIGSNKFSDLCYGYAAFWREVVPILRLDGDGFEVETQMNIRALQAGLKVAEMPSFESPRVHGTGRLRTIPDGWRVLRTIIHEWLRPTVRGPVSLSRPWAEATPVPTDAPVFLRRRAADYGIMTNDTPSVQQRRHTDRPPRAMPEDEGDAQAVHITQEP